MKERCFDEGTIQAFLDGELAPDLLETVAHHVAICDGCSSLLATAEEESAFAFSALEQEFNTLVPTQRLWTKINDSIESERKSIWQNVFVFVSNWKSLISNQTIVAFASLLIVFGLFVSVLILRNGDNSKGEIASVAPSKQTTVPSNFKRDESIVSAGENLPVFSREAKTINNTKPVDFTNDKKVYRAVKASFDNKENNQRPIIKKSRDSDADNPKPPSVETRTTNESIAGEESYIKTIATLTETVNNRKDEVLKPSAQFAFEKDLAVVDDAIKRMKAEVKNNPKNEGAKQVLISSYQNKIDLLNSVTEKNELMASLK